MYMYVCVCLLILIHSSLYGALWGWGWDGRERMDASVSRGLGEGGLMGTGSVA